MLSRGVSAACRWVRATPLSRSLHSSQAVLARVLCVDNVDPLCKQIFEDHGHNVTQPANKLSRDELLEVRVESCGNGFH